MQHPPARDPAADPQALPPRTTPTREMELLLSGATVFALLQAYGWIAPRVADVAELAGLCLQLLLAPLLLYLQAAMLALAGGLLLHLLLRAFRIALVGLHSVDSAGRVRESPSLGAWSRARIAAAWDAPPVRIAALDDQATIVFAVALGMARLMGLLFLYAGAMALVGLALAAATGGAIPASATFAVLACLLMVPFVVAIGIDSRAERRGRAVPALVQRVLGLYDRIGMTPQHKLSLQVLVYRLSVGGGRLRGVLSVTAIMLALMVATTALPLALRGDLDDRVRAGFPRLAAGDHATLRGVHYDDTAAGTVAQRVPSIPSMRVEGPWLPLFIPWVDLWHDEGLATCSAPHALARRSRRLARHPRLHRGAAADHAGRRARAGAVATGGRSAARPARLPGDGRPARRGVGPARTGRAAAATRARRRHAGHVLADPVLELSASLAAGDRPAVRARRALRTGHAEDAAQRRIRGGARTRGTEPPPRPGATARGMPAPAVRRHAALPPRRPTAASARSRPATLRRPAGRSSSRRRHAPLAVTARGPPRRQGACARPQVGPRGSQSRTGSTARRDSAARRPGARH